MPRIIAILSVTVLLTACAAMQTAPTVSMEKSAFESRNWNVAVLDLDYEFEEEGTTGVVKYRSAGADGGRVIASLLAAELASLPNITIIERRGLDRILEEQELQMSGISSEQTLAEIGELIGADAVVTGELTDYVFWDNLASFGSTVSMSIRMVDVSTGKVLLNASISRARGLEDIFPNAQKTVKELVDKLRE